MFDGKYLYPVTRTRALETKLLDKTKIERMIESKNGEEVIKVLSETDYAGSISEMNNSLDYEIILSKEIEKTYSYLKEISPTKELTGIFLLKYDIHNLKVLLKSSLLGEENEELFINVGTVPVLKLKEMMKEKDFRDLPSLMAATVQDIIDDFAVSIEPQEIDLLLDKCLYEMMFELAVQSKIKFLIDFVSIQIDLTNIKTFLRLKTIGFGRDYLPKVIFENGKLSNDFFAKYFEEPIETLAEKLWASEYHGVIEEGLEGFALTKSLTKLEKLADDFILNYVKKGKYVAFGVEPLVGYIMAKENEVKIIRIIMVGKINQIPNELIRERLRDVYV